MQFFTIISPLHYSCNLNMNAPDQNNRSKNLLFQVLHLFYLFLFVVGKTFYRNRKPQAAGYRCLLFWYKTFIFYFEKLKVERLKTPAWRKVYSASFYLFRHIPNVFLSVHTKKTVRFTTAWKWFLFSSSLWWSLGLQAPITCLLRPLTEPQMLAGGWKWCLQLLSEVFWLYICHSLSAVVPWLNVSGLLFLSPP